MTQYQLSGWSEEGLCQEPQAILELIERVAATQRRTGNNPIVVHGMYVHMCVFFYVCIMCVCVLY